MPGIALIYSLPVIASEAKQSQPYGVKASHNYNSTTIALAATVQACAVMPNFLITEYFVNFTELGNVISIPPIQVQDGYIQLPDAPGLGLELDEDALMRYPYVEFPKRSLPRFDDEGP